MMNNKKKGIIVLIVLLAIGFAAVTTTLTINGTIRLGPNAEDFNKNLKFKKASLIYSDTTKTNILDVEEDNDVDGKLGIPSGGKSITFTTDTLKNIGESVTLKYDIVNNSQYSAEFTGITCDVYDGTEIAENKKVANPEYITLEVMDFIETPASEGVDAVNKKIQPKGVLTDQTVKVTLKKSYVGTSTESTKSYTINCTINASGRSS